ncbi:MAG: hypothetical protein ACOZNI_22570 [Myxococcota bacterium]
MRILPAIVLLSACGPSFYTDGGQVGVALANVIEGGADGAPSPFLAGTRVVPALTCAADCPEGLGDVTACFSLAVEGPAALDGDAVVLEGAGDVVWRFTPVACDANDLGWAPAEDAVTVPVLAADDVAGTLSPVYEEMAADLVADGALRLLAPEGWVPAAGEPVLVAADRHVSVFPRLRTIAGEPVAWSTDGASLAAADVRGDAPEFAGVESVRLGPGDAATLTLSTAGATFEVGEVEGVDAGDVASLELALAYSLAEDGADTPVAARVVARDEAGSPVFGMPVVWETDREMALAFFGEPAPDYAWVTDGCVPPSEAFGPQTATLTARLGELSASATLAWTPRTEPGDDAEWVKDPSCATRLELPEDAPATVEEGSRSCGCGTGAAPGLAVLAIAAALNSRRSAPGSPRRAAPR